MYNRKHDIYIISKYHPPEDAYYIKDLPCEKLAGIILTKWSNFVSSYGIYHHHRPPKAWGHLHSIVLLPTMFNFNLIKTEHQMQTEEHSIKYLASTLQKSFKIMKETPKSYSRLKEAKETWILNTICKVGLYPELEKGHYGTDESWSKVSR